MKQEVKTDSESDKTPREINTGGEMKPGRQEVNRQRNKLETTQQIWEK